MSKIRTRFAPAPSGAMHLGNIRAALINLIFAKKHNGSFILRIEDTDKEKATEKNIAGLLSDLDWLGIKYDEGPILGGLHEPYFQSKRQSIYQKALLPLIESKQVYQCFCTKERLEELREIQTLEKQAPRYDRLCRKLSKEQIDNFQKTEYPFVWRFLVNHEESVVIEDMVRGPLTFELKNFTDFLISRSDGSFNFLFANFVDDVEMEITNIIRGEDHMSNGALQAILYRAINKPVPIFLHLPLILNEDGQKLSKSAQNFDLETLKKNGFLPEAICSYLGSIGSNLEDEAFTISEMIEKYDLSSISSQSVKYEIAKITSINRKFLQRFDSSVILEKIKNTVLDSNFLVNKYPDHSLIKIINLCKDSSNTLKDILEMFEIILDELIVSDEAISFAKKIYSTQLQLFLDELSLDLTVNMSELIEKNKITKKEAFTFLRLSCTGKQHGLTINQIFELLSPDEINKRISQLLAFII